MEFPKHTGGGWYELSDGESVRGKDEALAAEAALQGGGTVEAPVAKFGQVGRRPEGSQRTPTIELVQAACRIMWGLTTAEDGWFGPDTERKVREVQQRSGLEPSGVVDDATWAALLSGGG